VARKGIWIVGGATALFHLATSTIYGYHRDELYYLACGRRLAWGYADHPPLTPLLYRLSDNLLGHSLLGLRVVPALLHGALVVVTALLARELGATRRGEVAAATGVAIAPMFLTIGHFLTTVTAEVVAWTVAVLVLVRILRGGSPRLWVAFGAAIGVGLFDKWTTLLLVAGLAVGLLATRARRALLTPWALAGAVIAIGLWLPTVLWQASHGWPQLELSRQLRDPVVALFTAPYQVVLLGAASVVAIPGVRRLLGADADQRDRVLVIAFVTIVALVMITGGKPYYAGAFGPVLVAAGAARGGWSPSRRVFVAMGAIGLMTAPFALPLLPRSTAKATTLANKEIGEMVGWPEFVDAVARAHRQHPVAGIFAANYSEAATIEILGRDRGLPRPFSGHNAYWFWAHPHGTSVETLAVGFPKRYLDRFFADVEHVGTFRSPDGVPNLEDGAQIWLVRGQRASWDALWPRLQYIR
jgi:4-amino-4-deoxy-L-arabinose transferase-like glycosyltransferase